MAYTSPTPAEFKARHPKFAAVADGLVSGLLGEAGRIASQSWTEPDWRDAVLNLAAHLALEEGAIASNTGLKKVKAGDAEAEFDTPSARLSGDDGTTYGSTTYGRRFLAIFRRYSVGAVLVV